MIPNFIYYREIVEVLLAICGPGSMCRSLIIGASPIGTVMIGVGLEAGATGSLGNVVLLCGTGCKRSRRRPCIGSGDWAGKAGGRRENPCTLDLSDAWVLGWECLGVGSCRRLKLSWCLCWWDSLVVGFVVWSAWGPRGMCGPICWGNEGQSSWSNFRPETWGAGSLCLLLLEGAGALWVAWLVWVVARSPCEGGINLLFSL